MEVQVGIDDRMRIESDRDTGRELDSRARRLHAEEVGRGGEAVLRPQAHAAGRVLDAGPEVSGIAVPAEVVPDDEVVRPGRGV